MKGKRDRIQRVAMQPDQSTTSHSSNILPTRYGIYTPRATNIFCCVNKPLQILLYLCTPSKVQALPISLSSVSVRMCAKKKKCHYKMQTAELWTILFADWNALLGYFEKIRFTFAFSAHGRTHTHTHIHTSRGLFPEKIVTMESTTPNKTTTSKEKINYTFSVRRCGPKIEHTQWTWCMRWPILAFYRRKIVCVLFIILYNIIYIYT